MDKPILSKIVFTFYQEGNTNGTTNEDEDLEITVESCCGSIDEDGGFYVLRSNSGWSINGVNELVELFDKLKIGETNEK